MSAAFFQRRMSWRACVCAIAGVLLVNVSRTEPAPLWELVDPGGGGAALAIYRVPNSDHLFVASNVGGFRYSSDAGARFRVVNEGVDFRVAGGDNIQKMTGYRLAGTDHVIASATAGILYWRTVGPQGLGSAWQPFFDSRLPGKRLASTLGSLAVDPATRRLYAGIGNTNNIVHKSLTRLNPDLAGRVFIFSLGDAAAAPAPPKPVGDLSLTETCADVKGGPYFHISDMAAVKVRNVDHLYVGTTEGLLILTELDSGSPRCRQVQIPGRNPFVLAVRPDAANPDDTVLLLHEGSLVRRDGKSGKRDPSPLKGGLFHTTSLLESAPEWRNITPALAEGNSLGHLERSDHRPGELLLAGDARSNLGILFTANFSSAKWQSVLNRSFIGNKSSTKDADGWRRVDRQFSGVKGVAIDDGIDGIATVYVSGFQGRFLTGRRDDSGFRFEQTYTIVDRSNNSFSYRNRGLPLMFPWRAHADPRNPDRVLFLYHDNVMFVSNDAGSSFLRPLMKFGWGTDVVYAADSGRVFVAYSKGNHLESNWRTDAELGGIFVGTREATEWGEISPRLPENGPVESLSMIGDDLCAIVYRRGVFCTALDRKISWRRAVPEALDVLHLLDVTNDDAIWLVVADANSRQICRVLANEPACSDLPAEANEFERLWYDEGRLWLAPKNGKSYTSELRSPLRWEPVDAAIADLRTVTLGQEPIALITSGIDGIFASRTPLQRRSWCRLSAAGLDGNRILTRIADPSGGDYLFVAVDGVGFYRASLDDLARDISKNCTK